MPSTKNIVTSVALALAGANSVTAVPVTERGLQACEPEGNECPKGQACLSGESVVGDGAFGLTAFFCQDADEASKRALKPCSPEGDECGSGEVCLSGDSAASGSGSFGITAFFCQSMSDDDADDDQTDESSIPQKRFRPYICPENGCPDDMVCKNQVVNDPTTGSTIGPLDVCVSADAASTEKRFTPYLCPENGCPNDMVCKNKKVKDPTTGTMIGPLDVCVSA